MFDLAVKLAEDIADGKLDSKDMQGVAIKLPGSDKDLHELNESGLDSLVDKANEYVSSHTAFTGSLVEDSVKEALINIDKPLPTTMHSGIAAAKALIASLRTNVNLLSNDAKSGFLDKQGVAIEADLKQVESAVNGGVNISIDYLGNAVDLIRNGDATGTVGDYWDPCVVTATGSEVVCQWEAWSEEQWVIHQLTIAKNPSVANSYTWTEGVMGYGSSGASTVGDSDFTIVSWDDQQGYVANLDAPRTVLSTIPVQTGTGTIVYNSANDLVTLNVNGRSLPTYLPTSSHAYTEISLSGTRTKVSNTHDKVELQGSITAKNSADQLVTKIGIGAGSTATFHTDSQRGGESFKLIAQAESAKYSFVGTFDGSNSDSDKVKALSFSGGITNKSDAAIGDFMTGTVQVTDDRSNYNKDLPKSPTNYVNNTLKFNGTVTNGSVSPAAVYQVKLDGSQMAGSQLATLTYTDPSNNTVTVDANRPNKEQKAVWMAQMGNTYLKDNIIYLGKPADGVQIGSYTDTVFSFIDGSFESL